MLIIKEPRGKIRELLEDAVASLFLSPGKFGHVLSLYIIFPICGGDLVVQYRSADRRLYAMGKMGRGRKKRYPDICSLPFYVFKYRSYRFNE